MCHRRHLRKAHTRLPEDVFNAIWVMAIPAVHWASRVNAAATIIRTDTRTHGDRSGAPRHTRIASLVFVWVRVSLTINRIASTAMRESSNAEITHGTSKEIRYIPKSIENVARSARALLTTGKTEDNTQNAVIAGR